MNPTRRTWVDSDLYEIAKAVGATMGRTAGQQLSHWARIGREVEASSAVRVRDIQRAQSGHTAYDRLTPLEQATVRVDWDQQVEERLASLNLADEFAAAGRGWTDADPNGNPVTRGV